MNKELRIQVEKVFVTSGVSSGSGLAIQNDLLYVVGDDAEYIGKILKGDTQCTRQALYPNASEARTPKPLKHDLECAAKGSMDGHDYLFAFGSGGLSPYRETLFAVSVTGEAPTIRRSMQTLYGAIRARAGLQEGELNIEGGTVAGATLYLLNRGKNMVIAIPWSQFTDYIRQQDESVVPDFTLWPVELPVLNGFPIGFSGACTLSEQELLFTASLEETTDFYLDGLVKGSYIGILKMDADDGVTVEALTEVKTEKDESIADKLESIDLIRVEDRHIQAAAVADNDDGSSKVFYLSIERL